MNNKIMTFFIIILLHCDFLFAQSIQLSTKSNVPKEHYQYQFIQNNNRKILSNIGSLNVANTHQLTTLTYQNVLTWAGNKANLTNTFISDIERLEDDIKWVSGFGIYRTSAKENIATTCESSSYLSLNFRPIKINYGNDNKPEIYTLLGTNTGFLHMLKQYSGVNTEELWAFIPNELLSLIPKLTSNTNQHEEFYGIDGKGSVYIDDVNRDGFINPSEGDKVWFYFGLGRGGTSYYAIDISQPDTPKLMWHVDNKIKGFEQLGQTWAKATLGFSKINQTVNGDKKPVLFLSAGYDDKHIAGKGFYIVDADTGQLLFSATLKPTSQLNLQWQELNHSIASSFATMDSNSDGYVDRIYVGDTGGNVWRVDMPTKAPFDLKAPWSIHKLASLGEYSGFNRSADLSNNDSKPIRAFFNEPTIARAIMPYTINHLVNKAGQTVTSTENKPFDVIVLGSGNKAFLSAETTSNMLYMLKDSHIHTQSFNQNVGAPKPTIITENDLYLFAKKPYSHELPHLEKKSLEAQINQSRGWAMNYEGLGEKSISSSLVLSGVVYAHSYSPVVSPVTPFENRSLCDLDKGMARLYAVNLLNASSVYSFRHIDLGSFIPESPSITVVPSEEQLFDINLEDPGLISSIENTNEVLIDEPLAVCDTHTCISEPMQATTEVNSVVLTPNKAFEATLKLKTTRTSLYIQGEN